MGNCTAYCSSCGDEATQVNTLDQSQVKHSIKDKDYGMKDDGFHDRYNGQHGPGGLVHHGMADGNQYPLMA